MKLSNFQNGEGSGANPAYLNELRVMEADDVETDSEISHEVSPPPPVATTAQEPSSAAANQRLQELAKFVYGRDPCEANEIDGAGVFV